jgi:hypothetical protein
MSLLKTALAVILAALAVGSDILPVNENLVVHEWGTFTSVAAEDGSAVQWAPLSGTPDLPCFVNHLSPRNLKLAPGLVRMETPVLYFYAPRSMSVSVHVNFPLGWITEWYPQATQVKPEASPNVQFQYVPTFGRGAITWDAVQLSPGKNPEFPLSQEGSRYYAARNTDAAPLRINEQEEKFIFYRGIASFSVPLEPKFASGEKLEIRNTGSDTIPQAILFENRDGNVGYRLVRDVTSSVMVDIPELTGSLEELRTEVVGSLVKSGLYEKEALAVLETWQDSWFEEGMRVFYIVPRRFVDSQLPLKITPAPAALARVFVGRIEVLSPWTQQLIEGALTNGDVPTLMKFGRFLDPFVRQIRNKNSGFVLPPAAEEYLRLAYLKDQKQLHGASCIQ